MHQSHAGSVILSWVQYANFLGPKHLYAQKIASDGSEVWKSRVAVFDGGSLQFGDFPEFTRDAAGGAVFSWYDTANGLNVFAQHLNTAGVELLPHNGVAASTAPRERVAPASVFHPQSGSIYVAWIELDNNQGSQGVYAQRIDSAGNRMWTESGAVVSPIDTNPSGSINLGILDGNLITLWIENAGGFGQDQIFAHALTQSGADAWNIGTQTLASDLAQRSRLTTATSSSGHLVAGWQIGDFGVADIETHNINADGTLGDIFCPADFNNDNQLDFFDVGDFLEAYFAMDPIADFTDDGKFNFFDVAEFLEAYALGCP